MTMPRPRSLYDVLNVSPHAEAVVIEAAYKALIKKYHPDQAPEAEVFSPAAADINKAFKVLKDPSRRAEYDHRLWVREQAMRAAELQGAEPRRGSRFAGLAGWAMALVLAAAVAAMAVGRGGEPPAGTLAAAAAAEEATADAEAAVPAFLTKERVEADLKTLRAVTSAQIANAEAAPPPAPRIEVADSGPPAAEASADPPPAPERVAAAPPPSPPRARPKPPRRKAAPKQPGDFLEREGYIY